MLTHHTHTHTHNSESEQAFIALPGKQASKLSALSSRSECHCHIISLKVKVSLKSDRFILEKQISLLHMRHNTYNLFKAFHLQIPSCSRVSRIWAPDKAVSILIFHLTSSWGIRWECNGYYGHTYHNQSIYLELNWLCLPNRQASNYQLIK